MEVTPTAIPGVLRIRPRVFADARGDFTESFRAARYAPHGITGPFVQDNVSHSVEGVRRGLHVQHPHAQGKLVTVVRGAVLDVAVDVRRGSPTFGEHVALELRAEARDQLWLPPGLAHGFEVIEGPALLVYKCTAAYAPDAERTIRADDPALGIAWRLEAPLMSERDRDGARLAELPEDALPRWEG